MMSEQRYLRVCIAEISRSCTRIVCLFTSRLYFNDQILIKYSLDGHEGVCDLKRPEIEPASVSSMKLKYMYDILTITYVTMYVV